MEVPSTASTSHQRSFTRILGFRHCRNSQKSPMDSSTTPEGRACARAKRVGDVRCWRAHAASPAAVRRARSGVAATRARVPAPAAPAVRSGAAGRPACSTLTAGRLLRTCDELAEPNGQRGFVVGAGLIPHVARAAASPRDGAKSESPGSAASPAAGAGAPRPAAPQPRAGWRHRAAPRRACAAQLASRPRRAARHNCLAEVPITPRGSARQPSRARAAAAPATPQRLSAAMMMQRCQPLGLGAPVRLQRAARPSHAQVAPWHAPHAPPRTR
jgi:hypothetical protein